MQPADLARGGLDDDVAEGDLAVAAQGDEIASAHRNDGGAVELLHGMTLIRKRGMARDAGSGRVPLHMKPPGRIASGGAGDSGAVRHAENE